MGSFPHSKASLNQTWNFQRECEEPLLSTKFGITSVWNQSNHAQALIQPKKVSYVFYCRLLWRQIPSKTGSTCYWSSHAYSICIWTIFLPHPRVRHLVESLSCQITFKCLNINSVYNWHFLFSAEKFNKGIAKHIKEIQAFQKYFETVMTLTTLIRRFMK